MNKVELIIIGGFLGSGKTTSILNMAKHFLKDDKKVGIVTNDQGSDLVDTNFLQKAGLSVLEVAGGCFCCNFNEFVDRIQNLTESELPDVILAEPVGSCTDLIATLYKPLKAKYADNIELRPLTVIADPKRIKRLMLEKSSDFHSEINYLFEKQLQEADIIALNKVDLLSRDEVNSIRKFIKENFKNADVVCVSSKNNYNIDKWIDMILKSVKPKEKVLDIDYDKYANAERRLGWLNVTINMTSDNEIEINSILSDVIEKIRKEFIKQRYEIAHLKIYAVSDNDWAKVSITDKYENISFDNKAMKENKEWNMIINVRADIEPEELSKIINEILYNEPGMKNINITEFDKQCFAPKRPNPTYRLNN